MAVQGAGPAEGCRLCGNGVLVADIVTSTKAYRVVSTTLASTAYLKVRTEVLAREEYVPDHSSHVNRYNSFLPFLQVRGRLASTECSW